MSRTNRFVPIRKFGNNIHSKLVRNLSGSKAALIESINATELLSEGINLGNRVCTRLTPDNRDDYFISALTEIR